jgi:hypothetical protein
MASPNGKTERREPLRLGFTQPLAAPFLTEMAGQARHD